MTITPKRNVLLQMLADLEKQMGDAAALMGTLVEGSTEFEAASSWLADATTEAKQISQLLAASVES